MYILVVQLRQSVYKAWSSREYGWTWSQSHGMQMPKGTRQILGTGSNCQEPELGYWIDHRPVQHYTSQRLDDRTSCRANEYLPSCMYWYVSVYTLSYHFTSMQYMGRTSRRPRWAHTIPPHASRPSEPPLVIPVQWHEWRSSSTQV